MSLLGLAQRLGNLQAAGLAGSRFTEPSASVSR